MTNTAINQLIILASGTIITGCLNSIFTKYQDMQCVSHCDDPAKAQHFEQPVLQTLQMFLGESMSWLVLLSIGLYRHFDKHHEYESISDDGTGDQRQKLTLLKSVVLAIPACCDIAGTTLMNIGLIYTPVSIYQMTRGSVVLFVAGMSLVFLNRRISRIDWLSLIVVSLGVVIVGMSGSKSSPSSSSSSLDATSSPEQVIFGTTLIFIAEIFIATQFVVEEFIISRFYIVPLKLVAFEGTYGGLITLIIMITGQLFIGSTEQGKNGPFDMKNSFSEMFSSHAIILSSILIMVSIGSFNFFGISITNKLSATSRSTVDTCRTLLVWIVSIYIGWESFNWLQLFGFMLLVLGTLVFNGVVDLQKVCKLPKILILDQPNNARVIDTIDEQVERF